MCGVGALVAWSAVFWNARSPEGCILPFCPPLFALRLAVPVPGALLSLVPCVCACFHESISEAIVVSR